MDKKLDILLSICESKCEKCGEEAWLYIPVSDYYGLLCEKCMNKMGLDVELELTHKNIKVK